MGTHFADALAFVAKSKMCGCQYVGQWQRPNSTYKLALSDALAAAFPTLPAVFRALAAAPRSSFEFSSEKRLAKLFKKEVKDHPRRAKNMGILATEAERDAAPRKVRPVYQLRVEFYSRFARAREHAVCPGFKDD